MRGWKEGKNRVKVAILPIATFFMVLTTFRAVAQMLPEWATKIIEAEASRGGDVEELVTYCQWLMEHPLNLNRASEEELTRFPLLSSFQVLSILEYREEYGDILSVGELALIDGFNVEKVEHLLPFITLGDRVDIHRRVAPKSGSKVVLRGQKKYNKGTPFGYYGRYTYNYSDKLQVGATLANRDGTGYFRVGGLDLRGRWKLKSGVIGDFSARFGQGLLLWNSFSLSGWGAPSSVIKRGDGFYPVTSSSSEGVLRGIGFNVEYSDHYEFSLFYSETKLQTMGGRFTYKMGNFRSSIQSMVSIDKKGNRGGAITVDGVYSYRRCRFFGEGGFDYDLNGAALLGVVAPINSKLEVGTILRWYSPDYNSPYAGAYSSLSKCKNQLGLLVNLEWVCSKYLTIGWRGDIPFYPRPRHGVKVPSWEVESQLDGEISLRRIHTISLRWKFRYYSHTDQMKNGVRVGYVIKSKMGIYGGIKGEIVWRDIPFTPPGVAGYIEGGYLPPNKRWEVAMRITLYRVDNWEDRIYFYERDLPNYFSVPALYRRGVGGYIYMKYTPISQIGVHLKVGDKMVKGDVILTF